MVALMGRLDIVLVLFQVMVAANHNISASGPSLQHLQAITETSTPRDGTCGEWTAWIPEHINPAVVVQAVSAEYADVEQKFIILMETNSRFSRDNLYLLCLDAQSVARFRALEIHCVYVRDMQVPKKHDIWRLRVNVIACLLAAGYDVLASDADALWLGDPMTDLNSPRNVESSIVASRGSFPFALGREWGSTMCMGFALFRASGMGMQAWQDVMCRIVDESGDDQLALNKAAAKLGIVWDGESDMRYEQSTGEGRGVVPGLSNSEGGEFTVTLLPHSRYTRVCSTTPLSNETVVAHCIARKHANVKTWMKENHRWYADNSNDGL